MTRPWWCHQFLVVYVILLVALVQQVPLCECRIVGGIDAIDGTLHTGTRSKHRKKSKSSVGEFSRTKPHQERTATVPPEAKRVAMLTPYGPIRMSLLYNNAPETAKALYELASRQMETCVDCQFYRAEARGEGGGPPYSLLQGSLGKGMMTPTEQEGSRLVKAGDVVVIPPTSEFYIALGDHDDWSEAHTVVGMVDDFTVVDLIGVQAYEEVEHPDFKTLMRLMKEPVDFVLTTDMSATVMPRYMVEKSVHASVRRIIEDPALHRNHRVHRMDDIGGVDGGLSFSEPDMSVLDGEEDDEDDDSAMIASETKYKRKTPPVTLKLKVPKRTSPSLNGLGKKKTKQHHVDEDNHAAYQNLERVLEDEEPIINNNIDADEFEDGIESLDQVDELNGDSFEHLNGAFEDDENLLDVLNDEEEEEEDINLDKFAKLDFRNLP
jgi:cyclophilin family peptidyl-prolyl cis-trans isomerase